jgi:hypothetical protein
MRKAKSRILKAARQTNGSWRASGMIDLASPRELIDHDEKRKADETLEALLVEGLHGEETELSRTEWCDIRNEALVWRPRNNWTTHCFAFLRRGSVHPG